MDYELPTEFDLIVVGTGVVESIVSAAASRIGKRVLHIDSNNYYGGHWASFNLDGIQKLATSTQAKKLITETVNEGKVLPIGNNLFDIKDFSVKWHIPEKAEVKSKEENVEDEDTTKEESEEPPTWTQEKLMKDSRKFNIDLTPKLQFARGDFVELLISSNIARYSEYRSVSRVLTWLNGQLEVVPCSRSDVFANNKVSVIEKRMLMKLFTSLDSDEKELSEFDNRKFRAFLKEKKLTPNLIHYVLYAISMSTDETSCLQGIQNTKRFLNSLGRFGRTPFLFSMYGSGEITQGFCRLSAVFGGIYALSQPLNGLVFSEDGTFQALLCGKQTIKADHLVLGAEKAPTQLLSAATESYISRAVFITDKSVMDSEKEHLTLLLYPPEDGKKACTIIEVGTLTGTCPRGLYIVHLISRQVTTPEEDFKGCVKNLFGTAEESKSHILWSCYFSIPDTNDLDLGKGCPDNVYLCPGPDIDLDYDFSIKKAREIFAGIYPDLEFLPRAPDPEEIIIEGDETESKDEIETKENEAETKKDETETKENEAETKKNETEENKTQAIDEKDGDESETKIATP